MNKWPLWRNKDADIYGRFITVSKDNLFLSIGLYGLAMILLIMIATPWLASDHTEVYSSLKLLSPAWDDNGDLNYLLGVDQNGRDIFKYLLWSLNSSLILTFAITVCVVLLGSFVSLVATFVKPVRDMITIFFKFITTIPPLLMIMILAILSGNTLFNVALVIVITMLPRFIYNVYNQLKHELEKPYIMALRLDGLTSLEILWYSLIPNSWSTFITECINVYCINLLALTTLTFLNFGIESTYTELGSMMRNMIEIIPINKWGFLAPGFAIMIVILLLNLLNFGLQQFFSRRN